MKKLLLLVFVLTIVAIATLATLPKHFNCPDGGVFARYRVKEAASMLWMSADAYKLQHHRSFSKPQDLLQYIQHFVRTDTSTQYNAVPTESFIQKLKYLIAPVIDCPDPFYTNDHDNVPLQRCSQRLPCLKYMGILQFDSQQRITAKPNSAIFFNLDPDGNGRRGRISIYLYANGLVTTGETRLPNTTVSGGTLASQDKNPWYCEDCLH